MSNVYSLQGWAEDGPQVAGMLQARSIRSVEQQQDQNSPNLGPAFYPIPVCKVKTAVKDYSLKRILFFSIVEYSAINLV